MFPFPKKYKPKDICDLNFQYSLQYPNEYSTYALFSLPQAQSLHLGHYYALFLRDFLLRSSKNSDIGLAFCFSSHHVLDLFQAEKFFAKKNQTLAQVGKKKLITYLNAQATKGIKSHQKLLANYLYSAPQYFEPSSAFYFFVQSAFKTLWDAGKISFLPSIAYRSQTLQTSIPFSQIQFLSQMVKNYTIKYFVEMKNDILPVCVEDPDMIFGDVALLVHPQDKRYKKLIGRRAIIPIVNRAIPIKGDETVDISKNNGIKRVNPCSDEQSILLAKKHQLPLDHFVFDTSGNYTQWAGEYAGKPRSEFSPNILQFLEDISNLGAVYEEERLLPFHSYSQERLYPYLLYQLVLNLEESKDAVLQHLHAMHEGSSFVVDDMMILNRQVVGGKHFPLLKDEQGELYFVDFSTFVKYPYSDSLQCYFDYILFCCYRDGLIEEQFEEETLLKIFSKYSTQIGAYGISTQQHARFSKTVATFQSLIDSLLDKEKSQEKILSLIQNSPAITHGILTSSCNFSFLFSSESSLSLFGDTIDELFLSYLFPLFLKRQGILIDSTCYIERHFIPFLYQSLSLHYLLKEEFIYQDALLIDSYLDKKSERFSYTSLQTGDFSSLLKEFGVEPMRLLFLLQEPVGYESAFLYDSFLRQLWNGIRFICVSGNFYTSFDQAWKDFKEKSESMDIWIMSEFSSLIEEYFTVESYQQKLSFFVEIQAFIQKKFLRRYLEFQKLQPSPAQGATFSLLVSGILNILYPFIPSYVDALYQLTGVDKVDLSQYANFREKSYQDVVLYDLFDAISLSRVKLAIKQHQKISLFVKADPNTLSIVESFQRLLQTLCSVDQLLCVRLHEEDPQGFVGEEYPTFVLGLKVVQSSPASKLLLSDLEQQYLQQLEYLSYLRTLIANTALYATMSDQQQEEKKAEMEKVKQTVESLQLSIQRLKMKSAG